MPSAGCFVDGYSSTTDHAIFSTDDANILSGADYSTVHVGSSATQECDGGE